MNINIEYYSSLFKDFMVVNNKYFAASGNEKGYPHGLFLPYTFGNYESMKRKIFYFGSDTYYWFPFQPFVTDCEKYLNAYTKTDEIIKNYTNGLDDGIVNLPRLIKWGKQPGIFWNVVPRLHYYLQTGKTFKNISDLNKEDLDILKGIGYGNVNSIEIPKSLQNEGLWNKIDIDNYQTLKKNSESVFDKLLHTIKAYKPDYIIIFHRTEKEMPAKEKLLFDGLDYTNINIDGLDNIMSVYTLSQYNIKILWTAHPRALYFNGYGIDKIISLVADTIKELE